MRQFLRMPFSRNRVEAALSRNVAEVNKLTEEIERLAQEEQDSTLSSEERKRITERRERKIRDRNILNNEHHKILVEKGVM